MRLYIALIAMALTIAAICGAPLAWDGAYYLVKALDAQAPFTPHNRLSNALLQGPVLLLSHYTSDLGVLRLAYALAYAAVPLVAVTAAWWIVRRRAPHLFVWAALGIGLGTLPGQFNMNSEDLQAVQMFWPILLAIVVGLPRRVIPLVVVLLAFILVAHPISSVLCVLGAVAAFLGGLADRRAYRSMAAWAALFVALALVRYAVGRDSYEAGVATGAALQYAVRVSVIGPPLVALACAWSAAIVVATVRRSDGPACEATPSPRRVVARAGAVAAASVLVLVARPDRTLQDWQWILLSLAPPLATAAVLLASRLSHGAAGASRFLRFYGILGVLVAGIVLVPWGQNAVAWSGVVSFRDWSLVGTAPFMLLAMYEGLGRRLNAHAREADAREMLVVLAFRTRALRTAGIVFLAVLTVQGLSFLQLTQSLRQNLAQGSTPCIVAESITTFEETALGHWSVASFALLQQARAPNRLVLQGDNCAEFERSGRVRIAAWDATLGHGWFDLSRVERQRARMSRSNR